MQAPVDQGGTNVSGGQRQRLAIARALVKRAPVYIFDDSFSALDFRTDAQLRAALHHELSSATVIIVAQRVGTIMTADQIVVMDEGRVVGVGTPPRAARDVRDLPRDRLLPAHRGRGAGGMSGPHGMGGGRPGGPPPGVGGGAGRPGGGGPNRWQGGMMGMPAEKPKDFRGAFFRLLGRLRPEAHIVILVIGLAIVSVTTSVLGPRILGNATDIIFSGVIGKNLPSNLTQAQVEAGLRASGQGQIADLLSGMTVTPGVGIDFGALAQILLILVGIFLISSLFAWAQAYLMAGVTQRTVYRLRTDVDEKLGRLPLKYFDSHPRGDILSRVTNDIDNIGQTLQQSLTQLITSILTVIGVLVMMLLISPELAVISLLAVPASVIVAALIAKRSQKQFAAQWKITGTLNGHVEEMHTGHAIVTVFGRQKEALDTFQEQNEKLYDASYRAQFISGIIQPAMNFIANLNYVGMAVIGGLRVASGQLTLGDVQAFVQYSRQFTQPIIQTASILNVIQSAVASAERAFELLDETEEIPDVAEPQRVEHAAGQVVFDDVSFRYLPDVPLIDDLNLVVQPGHTIAIVGPDGCRQDDPRQPPDALLRDRRRPHHGRRRRHARDDPRRPAPHLRHGPPGRVALPRHDPREHRLRSRRARPRSRSWPPRRPPTWTTSCAPWPTATTRSSTTTRPTCRRARSSC